MKRQVLKFNDIKGMLNEDEMKGVVGGSGTTTGSGWEWGVDPNGNYYYRLNGSDTWTAARSLKEVNITAPSKNNNSNPYPNPFQPTYANGGSYLPINGGGGGSAIVTPQTEGQVVKFNDIKGMLKEDQNKGFVGGCGTGSGSGWINNAGRPTSTGAGYLAPNGLTHDGVFTSLTKYSPKELTASLPLAGFIGNAEGGFKDMVYTNDGKNTSNPTIGYGHKLTPAEIANGKFANRTITPTEAIEIWHEDMKMAVAAVRNQVTVKLTQNQFDALASFAFQQGYGNFGESNTLSLINSGDFDGAMRALRNVTKDHTDGRYRRHNEEADLFVLGDYTFTHNK